MRNNTQTAAKRREPMTVLIADDHVLVRDGIRLLINSIMGDVNFREAGDADSMLREIRSSPAICLAIVDLNMPGMDRGSRLAELAHQAPALPLVVVSALTSPDVVRRTLSIATVYAFVPKSSTSEHMRFAIEAAMSSTKLPFTQEAGGTGSSDIGLTPRLEEVRGLLRQGMSNKMIAATLGISEGTVKNHMTEIFRALKVSNRTQAAQINFDTL